MSQEQSKNKSDFISLSEAAKLTGYTPEYLNSLSRKGKFQAKKIGRNWYTKNEWVEAFLKSSPKESEEGTLMTLSEAAKLIGYTPEYLNLRARQGKLKAEKIGRNWHTKKEWVDEFIASVHDAPDEEKAVQENAEGKESSEENRGEEAVGDVKSEFDAESVSEKREQIGTIGTKKLSSDWMRIFAAMSSVVIIMPLVFAGTYAVKNFFRDKETKTKLAEIFGEDADGSKIVNENTSGGRVAAEEDVAASVTGLIKIPTALASENFKIRDISVGGDVMILALGENAPLEIQDVKSESFIVGKKNEAKMIVSWKTNKPAVSRLEYSKNNGQNPKAVEEDSYGFSHSAMLSGMDPGTSYVFQVKSRDRWANEMSSDQFGIYTEAKPFSVFDLIANAISEIFGWAIKK